MVLEDAHFEPVQVEPEPDPDLLTANPDLGWDQAPLEDVGLDDGSTDGADAGPEVSLPGPDGQPLTAPATYDATGDGAPDTVVMHGADGTVSAATDYDGDGVADQLTTVTPDGSVTVSAPDDDGQWRPVAVGRVTEDGGIVFGEPMPGAPTTATPTATPAGDPPPTGPHGPGTVPVAHPTGGSGMTFVDDGGHEHRLGAPDQDLDGDGVEESVAARTAGGHLLVVSDTDGDGAADRLIDVDERTGDVSWAVAADGGTGSGAQTWDVVGRGHVDDEGNLVVDGTGAELVVEVDGRPFEAGESVIDSDGDGVADTVALAGPGGTVQYYQDSDGDGFADRAWTADADGRVTASYVLDARTGTWTTIGT